MFVDAHCHLDQYPNPHGILQDCHYIGRILAVSTGVQSYHRTVEIAAKDERVIPSIGFHPRLISTQMPSLQRLLELVKGCAFVGEIGLDYYGTCDKGTRTAQYEAFREILRTAEKCSSVVIVHSKDAETDALNLLSTFKLRNVIMHWFTGRLSIIRRIVDNGYFMSFTPSSGYSAKERRIIERVPLDLLLTESDGPTRFRGVESTPCDVATVVDNLAKIKRVHSEDVRNAVWRNFQRILTGSSKRKNVQSTLE